MFHFTEVCVIVHPRPQIALIALHSLLPFFRGTKSYSWTPQRHFYLWKTGLRFWFHYLKFRSTISLLAPSQNV